MSKVMRFYNPKTKQYEPVNAGGVLDEDTEEILTGKDINKKADKSYVGQVADLTFDFWYRLDNKKADKTELDKKADRWALDKKADKEYVDNKVSEIDINQFEVINKGGYSFNNLKEPGVFRLWNSSTSPCGSTNDYIVAVYKYSNKITQVAHSATTNSSAENRVYVRYYTGSKWTSWRELTNVDLEKELDKKANKSHTHSANDISETYNRNFVTNSQYNKINKIDDKADKSHTHTTAEIEESYNRNFVTNAQWNRINRIDDKADKSHTHKAKDIVIMEGHPFGTLEDYVDQVNFVMGKVHERLDALEGK